MNPQVICQFNIIRLIYEQQKYLNIWFRFGFFPFPFVCVEGEA